MRFVFGRRRDIPMARGFLRTVVVCLAAVLLAGCAATPVYRFVDPAHDGARYDGFMAYGAFADPTIEAAFEQALCERLLAAGHACTPMLRAAPPTREQDAASRHTASRTSGAQATILIELADIENASRRVIGAGRPAYEISVIDNKEQKVVAKLLMETRRRRGAAVAQEAEALADRIVAALAAESLLYERSP
jgi:hypothetical protein